jgi:hypothetical protein
VFEVYTVLGIPYQASQRTPKNAVLKGISAHRGLSNSIIGLLAQLKTKYDQSKL